MLGPIDIGQARGCLAEDYVPSLRSDNDPIPGWQWLPKDLTLVVEFLKSKKQDLAEPETEETSACSTVACGRRTTLLAAYPPELRD
jgi:hypothetical protein